jgi:hypothetical protein
LNFLPYKPLFYLIFLIFRYWHKSFLTIRHQYPDSSFPEGAHSLCSIDWAAFRTEANEVIFQLLELSQADVEKILQINWTYAKSNLIEGERSC